MVTPPYFYREPRYAMSRTSPDGSGPTASDLPHVAGRSHVTAGLLSAFLVGEDLKILAATAADPGLFGTAPLDGMKVTGCCPSPSKPVPRWRFGHPQGRALRCPT